MKKEILNLKIGDTVTVDINYVYSTYEVFKVSKITKNVIYFENHYKKLKLSLKKLKEYSEDYIKLSEQKTSYKHTLVKIGTLSDEMIEENNANLIYF